MKSGSEKSGGWSHDVEMAAGGYMLPTTPQPYDVANCLTRRMHKGVNSTLDEGQTPIIAPQTSSVCPPLTTRPYGDNESQQNKLVLSQYGEIAGALTRRHDSSPCPDRGMTVVAIHPHCIGRSPSSGPQGKEYLGDGSAYTMDTRGAQAVAFAQNQIGEIRTDKVCGTINQNSNASGRNAPLLFTPNSAEGRPPIQQRAGSSGSFGVRRLTPRECERLQGFPDDYTAISWRGRPAEECPDGPRYKALGNSMAVPVMRWIGKRIEKYGSPA